MGCVGLAILAFVLCSAATAAAGETGAEPNSASIWAFVTPTGPVFSDTLRALQGEQHTLVIRSTNPPGSLRGFTASRYEHYELGSKVRLCRYPYVWIWGIAPPSVHAFVREACTLRIRVLDESGALEDEFELGRLDPNVYALWFLDRRREGGKFRLELFADGEVATVSDFWEPRQLPGTSPQPSDRR